MNKRIKADWIKKLRSGKYRQGHGYLLMDGRRCCLGVVCDSIGMKSNEIKNIEVPSRWGLETNVFLSKKIRDKIGITDRQQKKLADLNDEGHSFKKIADYIEKKL